MNNQLNLKMAKKKGVNKIPSVRVGRFRDSAEANEALKKLKLKDLKRQCIIRGMPFEDVVQGYVPTFQSFFVQNFHIKGNTELLADYDAWIAPKLVRCNLELFGQVETPDSLRMGTLAVVDEATGKSKTKRIKGIKKNKVKVEKNQWGIRVNCAKGLVGLLAQEGKSLDEILKEIKKEYPGKSDKSVSIWYKKFQKLMADGKKK